MGEDGGGNRGGMEWRMEWRMGRGWSKNGRGMKGRMEGRMGCEYGWRMVDDVWEYGAEDGMRMGGGWWRMG